jgi:hypothetical protein
MSVPDPSSTVGTPIRLATLVCERDAALARECIGSFVQHCAEPLAVNFFEDGSLSEAGRESLRAAFPAAEFIARDELEVRTEPLLRNRAECRKHRAGNATMLKILDIPAFFEGTPFLFCDSDVLVLRAFSLGAYRSHAGDHFVFMQDRKEAYSARIFHLVLKHRLAMPSRLNSGLMSIPPGRFDPDFVEWFLRQPDFCAFPQVVEQTAWAGMTRNERVRFFDPAQIVCASTHTVPTSETVAIHFPSHFKSQLPEFRGHEPQGREPVDLRLVRPQPLGVGALVANAWRNRFGKWE